MQGYTGLGVPSFWLGILLILVFALTLGIQISAVFAWPGLGRLIIQAVEQRDCTVVQAALLGLVLVFLLINLVTDIMYAVLDPRIRLSGARG